MLYSSVFALVVFPLFIGCGVSGGVAGEALEMTNFKTVRHSLCKPQRWNQ